MFFRNVFDCLSKLAILTLRVKFVVLVVQEKKCNFLDFFPKPPQTKEMSKNNYKMFYILLQFCYCHIFAKL